MWILSKSITYHCAQDMEVSTLDSKAFCRLAEARVQPRHEDG